MPPFSSALRYEVRRWPGQGCGRDIPAIDADVDSGELIAAQLPQVIAMHDPGHGSQARSCPATLRAVEVAGGPAEPLAGWRWRLPVRIVETAGLPERW